MTSTGKLSVVTRLAAFALVGLVAGCAAKPPPPPALLSLDGQVCGAEPAFIGARPIQLDAGKSERIDLDAPVPCFSDPDGSKSSYAIFAVPESPVEYIASVSSMQRGDAMLSPRILVFDPLGHLLRIVPHDSFQFHGESLRASLRIHPGDRYIAVASDPQTVTQPISQIVEGTGATSFAGQASNGHGGTAGLNFTYHYGTETQNAWTYSYNGVVTVSAFPLPKAQ